MATIKTIKPDGSGDYTLLDSWEDVADGQDSAAQWAECYQGGNLGEVNLSGWSSTPSATAYPRIYVAPGHQHDGITGGAYIQAESSHAITVGVGFVRIEGLRITQTSGSNRRAITEDGSGFPSLIEGCLFHGLRGDAINLDAQVNASVVIRNCIVRDGNDDGIDVGSDSGATVNLKLDNLTIYNCQDDAIKLAGGTDDTLNITMRNCLSIGNGGNDFTKDAYATVVFADYNCDSDGTLASKGFGGTHNLASKTAAEVFLDADNDDLQLAATSPATNAGLNLSAEFAYDILGFDRPQGAAWDMGAHESPKESVPGYLQLF